MLGPIYTVPSIFHQPTEEENALHLIRKSAFGSNPWDIVSPYPTFLTSFFSLAALNFLISRRISRETARAIMKIPEKMTKVP
jgi:hypothetical protein